MTKVIKCKMKFVYSSLVFRLAGPTINMAARHFQSCIFNSETIKETENSTCTYTFEKKN